VAKHLNAEILSALKEAQTQLSLLEASAWNNENIHAIIIQTAEKFNLGLGKVAQALRVAVTGGAVSPPIDATLRVLGKQKVLERIKAAIDR